MYGWRGRIGLLVPSTNYTAEMEFHRAAPEGVSVHTTRCAQRDTAMSEEEKIRAIVEMSCGVVTAAMVVACVRPKVIAWACTAGSFLKGIGHDLKLIEEIERETGIPALTTSTAVVQALKALNLRKIAMVTPYIQRINQEEKSFLEGNLPGLEVVTMQGLGIMGAYDKGALEPQSAYKAAREVDSPEAEGIFISCTAWRTFEIIEFLEKDLGKPVVTSNQATLWASLKVIGAGKVHGYGRLMELP